MNIQSNWAGHYGLYVKQAGDQGRGQMVVMGSLVECTQAYALRHDQSGGAIDGSIVDLSAMKVAFVPDPNTPGAPCFIDWIND